MPKSETEQEVLIIGDDFTPGAQANSEIDYLLGFNTHMLDDQAVRSEKFGCSIAPNYCQDAELSRQLLEKFKIYPLIIPTLQLSNRKNKVSPNGEDNSYSFTASFIFKEEHHLTIPFDTEELALSCALWYVLAYHT